MNLAQKILKFTVPQLLFVISKAKETFLEWGRGGGKSTVVGWRIKDFVNLLPRAKIGIVGSTYQQLLTRTLPSTVEGLSLLGYQKDLHYFVGKRPPKEWKWLEAYQPPLSYDNYVTFYNGTGFQLISLENPDAGRGLNLDGVIGDEAALMDFTKLSDNVLLSNRGNIHRFNHAPWLHHSHFFSSTTPVTLKGRWFTNQEENHRRDPKNVYYSIASSRYNQENLGADFFRTNRRLLTPMMYDAEIECIRPGRVSNGFYPAFDELRHTYEASNDRFVHSLNYDLKLLTGTIPDADVLKNEPIDLACDYGAKINTLTCGQLRHNTFYLVNALHVKTPDTIKELGHKFCDYYIWHENKTVIYWHDHTAIGKYSGPLSFAEQFISVLEARGWTVISRYVGQAPRHDTKYLFFDMLFKEESNNLPKIRLNQEKCKYLIMSIEQAGAKEGRNGIEKDKAPERKQNAVDEETTHYSDAFDSLVYHKFKDGLGATGWMM